MMARLLNILRCGTRADDLEREAHAALDRVENEAEQLREASVELSKSEDPIATFVHGINHNRLRDMIRRGG